MIPKVIHYCWFGESPKTLIVERCIHSWKTYCPDYEIIEWNESNSDQFSNKFYRQALRKKQYAFAADYIRIRVLEKFGGIYLDTDMLLINNINHLLHLDFFIGKEDENYINFGIIGCKCDFIVIKSCKEFYNSDFDYINPITIPVLLTSNIINSLINAINYKIFNSSVFYPVPYSNRLENYSMFIKDDSLTIHLWNHSWKKENKKSDITMILYLLYDFLFLEYNFSFFKKYFFVFFKNIVISILKKKNNK